MLRDIRKFLHILLVCFVVATAVLSSVHFHANPSEHHACVVCRFVSTLNLFVLAIIGAVTGSAASQTFRRFIDRNNLLRIPEFLLGQRTLRAPPALLTA